MTVLLAGSSRDPVLVAKARIELADPAVPESSQPFHEALELPPARAAKTIERLGRIVEACAQGSVKTLIDGYQNQGYRIRRAGIVAGSVVDPATIKNDHIRAHAEEGKLFRTVIERAAKACNIKPTVTAEKNLYSAAASSLGISEGEIRGRLAQLGRGTDGSWRSEEKCAALAAWILL